MAINLSDNIKVKAPKSNDSRYLSSTNVIPFPQPYSADTEVYATIPVGERYIGLTVNINNEDWWFKNDVNTLVLKSGGASEVQNVGAGTGEVYSGTSGTTIFLRTLVGSGGTTVATVDDEIRIYSSGETSNLRNVDIIDSGLDYTGNTSSDYLGINNAVKTVYMPASPIQGQQVTISDEEGNANTFPITIDGNGNTFDGLSDTQILINTDYGSITILYNGTFWKVISFSN
jgi:hypothetical protein